LQQLGYYPTSSPDEQRQSHSTTISSRTVSGQQLVAMTT
jgi:hypothetical protein